MISFFSPPPLLSLTICIYLSRFFSFFLHSITVLGFLFAQLIIFVSFLG